jgi:hypothetical protein
MPKEIVNKTKEETYYKRKKIWVDGCENYVRIGGNEGDYTVIKK